MTEHTGTYLDKLNQNVSLESSDVERHQAQAGRAASRWGRFLRMKSRMSRLPLFRNLQLLRADRDNVTRLTDWARALSFQEAQRARQAQLRHEIIESRREFERYMAMAQYAINLAVQSESNPKSQMAKRQALTDRWRTLYQRMLFKQ